MNMDVINEKQFHEKDANVFLHENMAFSAQKTKFNDRDRFLAIKRIPGVFW